MLRWQSSFFFSGPPLFLPRLRLSPLTPRSVPVRRGFRWSRSSSSSRSSLAHFSLWRGEKEAYRLGLWKMQTPAALWTRLPPPSHRRIDLLSALGWGGRGGWRGGRGGGSSSRLTEWLTSHMTQDQVKDLRGYCCQEVEISSNLLDKNVFLLTLGSNFGNLATRCWGKMHCGIPKALGSVWEDVTDGHCHLWSQTSLIFPFWPGPSTCPR